MKLILADKKELEVTVVTKQYITDNMEGGSASKVALDIALSKSCKETVEDLVAMLTNNTSVVTLVTATENVEFKGFTKIDGVFERYDVEVRQVNIRLSK